MDQTNSFSEDYCTARQRFRDAAGALGWQLEEHPIAAAGPNGEVLTIDVVLSPDPGTHQGLVLSSGVHGVEGFFGSAVQVGLLDQWRKTPRSIPSLRIVLLHGVNPFGFAWLRRCDENNVDPNRNFLLPGEPYAGAPAGYASLDSLINPKTPPSSYDLFLLKALWVVTQRGMSSIRQSVAGGQYEFPRGLFFGGSAASQSNQILSQNLGRWLRGCRDVVHLDFHTGLGRSASCKLLIDYALADRHRSRLTNWFGADAFEISDPSGISYDTRGGLGRWCLTKQLAHDYLYACAEFGTFGAIQMLAGLRAENQAHHWGDPTSLSTRRAKNRLKELFAPSSATWRSKVLQTSFELVTKATNGLLAERPVAPIS